MPHGPRESAHGRSAETIPSASAVVAIAVESPSSVPSAWRTSVGRSVSAIPRSPTAVPVNGSRLAGEPGDGRRRADAGAGVQTTAPPSAGGLDGQGQERQEPERAEERAGPERETCSWVAPGHGQPGEREDAVDDRGRLRDVPEREHRRRQGHGEPEPWRTERGEARGDRERGEERSRPERQQRAADHGRERRHARRGEALPERDRRGLRTGRLRDPSGTCRLPLGAWPRERDDERLAQVGREPGCLRALGGIDRERGVDRGEQAPRKVTAARGEGRRPGRDGRRDLRERNAPERMAAGECLPEDHADRPHVASLRRLLPGEPLGRDVRERAGNVADGGQRVRLVELREPEVEHPHGDVVGVLHQHVRRLDVAMDDSAPVRVREPVEHLRGDLDRRRVVDLLRAQNLAQRPAPHVLVRDVDVARVAAEVVGADASFVAQPGRGFHLARRARRALSLTGNDLERDLEPGLLVPREPDRSRAPATERLERPIAVEDERSIGECEGCGRHR